jgi:hypothetical protein
MESLLGKFYTKIKGSQEDIASESLVYILNKSFRARRTINQIIKLNTGLDFSDLIFETQSIGENLERPDISGIDETGNEVVIIEAKFWASLTENQPNSYLTRLPQNSVLIFLVPPSRVRALYNEILRKVNSEFTNLESDAENQIIKLTSLNKFVLIKSWQEILNFIKTELIQENNQILISDIDQLIGFCDTIDNNSFQPITDEDLAPKIPRKLISYYNLVDKVVDELKSKIVNVSTEKLTNTFYKFGYRRYFSVGGYGLAVDFSLQLWAEEAEIPFWLSVSIIGDNFNDWGMTHSFAYLCKKVADKLNIHFIQRDKEVLFALSPKLNATEDEVISNLILQIEKIFYAIEDEVQFEKQKISEEK